MEEKYINMTLEEFFEHDTNESIYNILINYEGYEFVASIHRSISGYKSIWADKGITAIPIDDCDTLEKLQNRLRVYIQDKYICLRCGSQFNAKDYDRYERFFAGIYCKNCWTDKDEKDREWAYSD